MKRNGLSWWVGLTVLLLSAPASAGNAAFTGDDWSGGTGSWTCWDTTIPSGASDMDFSTAGGTGDADLRVFKAHGAVWSTSTNRICNKYSSTNTEDCSAEVQSAYNSGSRNFTICVYAYSTVSGVGVDGGYTTSTGGASSGGNPSPTYYYLTCYKDLLFWPAYHRECCLIDYADGTGYVRSDQDYDGFSDNDYCRIGEHWTSGPSSHEAEYTGEYKYLGTDFASAKAQADSCGYWTNEMHGHSSSNRTQYLRRPSGCSYSIFSDCNSDCWISDFAQCMGFSVSIVAGGCVDE